MTKFGVYRERTKMGRKVTCKEEDFQAPQFTDLVRAPATQSSALHCNGFLKVAVIVFYLT